MRLIEKAYKIAQKEIGQREIPGNKDNLRIIEYLKSCDWDNEEMDFHDEIPHCSAFANWCIQQAGGKGTRSAAARSFLHWGKEVPAHEVREGDIVVFKRGTSKWQGHVAFVVEVGPLFVKCLGGNQSDQVCIDSYRKSRVIGFRTSKD